MENLENEFDEGLTFDDADDEQNINAILNDQQDSGSGLIKNLLIILVIIGLGIAVFWGSFLLGKKVFTSSIPQTQKQKQDLNLDQELMDFDMPDEKVIYEIEKSRQDATAKRVIKKQIRKAPSQDQPTVKGLKFKVIAGSYSNYDNAKTLQTRLKSSGFDVYTSKVLIKGQPMWRVQIGALDTFDQAKQLIQRAKKAGFDAFYIQE